MSFYKSVIINALWSAAVLLSAMATVLAGQREIRFPITDGAIIASPDEIGFLYDREIGFAYGFELSPNQLPNRLYSFSVAESKVLEEFNLSAEFGSGIAHLKFNAHADTGLIAIASFVAGRQKLLVLKLDGSGHFSKLWAIAFPTSAGGFPSAIFNEDGTKIYAFYKDAKPRLAMINAEDGTILAATDLPTDFPDTTVEALLLFDRTAKRPIVMTDDDVHIFAPESEGFRIEWSSPTPVGTLAGNGITISEDGRFLFGYTGSAVHIDPPLSTNNFLALDLKTKEFHQILLKSKLAPSSSAVAFHLPSGSIFVPYSGKIKIKKSGFEFVGKGSNKLDILQLGADGQITQVTQLIFPAGGADSNLANFISPHNNIALSETGAIGFISSLTLKRIFAFDTMTGEVVNEIPVPDAPTFIYRPEGHDLIVYANGTNKLVVLDIDPKPVISEIKVSKKRTMIRGANFLSGARVEVNGEDLGIADRNHDNPGHEITINRGKKDFPAGQDVTIVITNRDGLSSKPFTFRR
ncbi:MAG TPA: hypothetical protein VNN73_10995 [Blastocatellia bacterium]|nr:hypothetical protein [Blastocatellia bacterium]